MRFGVSNLPSSLSKQISSVLKPFLMACAEVGCEVLLEAVPDQLDIFRMYMEISPDALCDKVMPAGLLRKCRHVDEEGFVWVINKIIIEGYDEIKAPWLVIGLAGVAKKCDHCHLGERQSMTFDHFRHSGSRTESIFRYGCPEVEAVACWCTNQECRHEYSIDPPTDSHALKHWEYVLAEQEDWSAHPYGGVLVVSSIPRDHIVEI